MFITSLKAFAEWFNEKYTGAYRQITPGDVNDMISCGLICRRGYYSESIDGETIRAVLQYEQMWEKRIERLEERGGRDEAKAVISVLTCKRCGQPLPASPQEKNGRHKEYCADFEPVRSCERNRKWRRERQSAFRRVPSGAT